MAHTASETVPGRVRMRLHALPRWRSCSPPLAPTTRAGRSTAALDSTELLSDGRALRARLDRDGYVFICGLLPAQTILSVRERLLARAAAGGWLDPGSPIEAGIANPAAACKDPEDRFPLPLDG